MRYESEFCDQLARVRIGKVRHCLPYTCQRVKGWRFFMAKAGIAVRSTEFYFGIINRYLAKAKKVK